MAVIYQLYPNGELRARVAAPVPAQKSDGGRPPILVNQSKLALAPDLASAQASKNEKSCDRPGYGATPKPRAFSLYARRQIARSGGCFSPAGEGRTVFLTGTIPGGTREAFQAVADWSSWIVHQLQREIPEVIDELASNLKSIWVWEFQRRGALHWHGVYECKTTQQARLLINSFAGIWVRTMRGVAARSGVDIAKRRGRGTWKNREDLWRTDAQLAQKDPSRYLAKYLSKDPGKGGKASIPYPTRWFQCSRALLNDLKGRILTWFTSAPKPQGGGEVSDTDLSRLEVFNELSEHTVSFGCQFNAGVSIVFYISEQDRGYVMEILETCSFQELLAKVEENRHLEARTNITFRRHKYRNIDECLARNYLAERLWQDCGEHYRRELAVYVNGDTIDLEEMFWVDRTAGQILHRAGFFVSQSEAAPIRGLTQEVQEHGKSGGCHSQAELDLDIPF